MYTRESPLTFTLMCERHAGVHFHARVSTLTSTCLRAAVPPMPADSCMEQSMEAEPRTTLRTTRRSSWRVNSCISLCLFVETYGTERRSRTADDITNDLKISWSADLGLDVSLGSGYQETAAYCQFGWEPYRKNIASTSNGEAPGSLQVSANPQRVLARAAVGRDTPCMLVSARCGSVLARVCEDKSVPSICPGAHPDLDYSPEGQQHY